MKKILIFSTAYFPLIGGAEVAVKEITDRLGTDFCFDMITARLSQKFPQQEKIGQINIFRFGFGCWLDKYWLALRGAAFAQKLHRQNKYDAIWSIMASYNGFAAVVFKNKNPEVPYLLTLQEGDPIEHILKRVRLVSPWFKKIFTRANYIQAISNFLANWAKEMGTRCPIEVVPNGVDIGKLQDTRNNSQKIKDELNIRPKEKVIISVSRLVKKNGMIDLVGAMNFLPENIKLLIAGEGEEENNLKAEIKKLKLEKRVILLGSMLPDNIPQYLSVSDVFVRPSLSEGLGSVFLEAMGAGVPVIGTNVGGIPDFLKNGETGLFCEVKNPQSIAEKVKMLLADAVLRQKLIDNGRQLVKEKYDWEKIALKMKEIFSKLIVNK